MKVGFIIVLYQTPVKEIDRLTREIKNLGIIQYKIYFIDHTVSGKGFAEGVNEGIQNAIKDGCEVFIVCNPDISISHLNAKSLLEGSSKFDIYGLGMKQDGLKYYGGKIDKWRMSGGLNDKKSNKRFIETDFVTGSFMVIKKRVIDAIGLFDERYFMYYEDVDYCFRARRAGLKVGIDTVHVYTHFEVSKQNSHKKYMLAKNRIIFLLRYGNLLQKIREFFRSPRTLFEERGIIGAMIWNSQFIRNFFSLNISSIINKLLHFTLFITMIRFIPVKEYGIYILVWAHVNIFSPLTDFGTTSYGMVYLPREAKKRVFSLFTLRMFFSLLVFILTITAAYVFRYSPHIVFLIFIISSVTFFNATSGMYLILSSVSGSVVKASLISIFTNLIMIGISVIAAVTFKTITSIIICSSICYILFTLLYFLLIHLQTGGLHFMVYMKEWKQIIKKSYIFVLISLFAGLYFRIDVFILNFLKGTSSVGVYSSGYKFLDALMLFVSTYNTIAAPSLSKIFQTNRGALLSKITKHLIFLSCLGFGTVIITLFFGNLFLPFILKGSYLQAIPVVRILVWTLPLILFNSLFLNLLFVSDLSYVVVGLFMIAAVLNAGLNFIFIPHFSYVASSYITVFSECVNLGLLLILVFIIYRKKIFYD